MTVKAFAPAKINLTLHVTGQRPDGYHELDSLVIFADVGDKITIKDTHESRLIVSGPMSAGVPGDDRNLVLKAAKLLGVQANIKLKKYLPQAAGIGGGSSDAAATIRALCQISGKEPPTDLLPFGADVAVCMSGVAARMQGVGNIVTPLAGLPQLHAVLVNPNLPVMTAEVFKRLKHRSNPAMPDTPPPGIDASAFIDWLGTTRNDLQVAAIEAEPVIQQVFETLEVTPGCLLTRISGSGGTCFGLYGDAETAASAAGRLQESHPGWWVTATVLNKAKARSR